MSIQSKTQIKFYFKTGDVPTEAEYIHLIDTLIAHPLVVTWNTVDTYVIPVGFMLKTLMLFSTVPVTGVKVGDSAGKGEYFDGNIADSNIPIVIDLGFYAHISPKTIHLTGGTLMSYKAYLQ